MKLKPCPLVLKNSIVDKINHKDTLVLPYGILLYSGYEDIYYILSAKKYYGQGSFEENILASYALIKFMSLDEFNSAAQTDSSNSVYTVSNPTFFYNKIFVIRVQTDMEIERKFLMSSPPELLPFKKSYLERGYLSVDPEVRFTKKFDDDFNEKYELVIKSDGTLSRKEITIPINKEKFDSLNELIGLPLIRKYSADYYIECDSMVFHYNEVDWSDSYKFIYGEIEFIDETWAKAFKIPDCLAPYIEKEITNDQECKMKNYWAKTRLHK